MPVFEVQCQNEQCVEYGITKDTILRAWTEPNPKCPGCTRSTTRLFKTPPKVGWAKPIGAYGDPSREYYDESGFWQWRVKSTRNPDGSPERVRISTRQEMVQFARDEGLRLPDDMNANAEISKDGRSFATSGVKGQWTGVPSRMVTSDIGHEEGFI